MLTEVVDILMRIVVAGFLGACIGFERRIHHKAIGITGMVLIAIGSTTYMLLGRHLAEADPSSISRSPSGVSFGDRLSWRCRYFQERFRCKGDQGCRCDLDNRSTRTCNSDVLLVARHSRVDLRRVRGFFETVAKL